MKNKKNIRNKVESKPASDDMVNRIRFFSFKILLKKQWKVFIFLFILVCLTYANSLNGDFVSDDTRSILNNTEIDKTTYFTSKSRVTLHEVFCFMINKGVGKKPIFFRLVNIGFHLGVVWLVYILFSFLFDSRVSLFAVSIFAVHPILSESVSWISACPYILYSFFVFMGILTYFLTFRNNKWFFVTVMSFILSLFSHDMAMVFPLILLAVAVSFSDIKKDYKKLIPFFIIMFVLVLVYLGKARLRLTTFHADFYQESQTMNPFVQIPIAITSYLGLIFWPKVLTLYHSELIFSLTQYFVRLALFIVFLGVVIYSFRKSRRVFFGFSLFLISLLPTLTPLGITWVVAERYVYLGSIGIFLVFAIFINKLSNVKNLRIAVNIIFFLIIVALMARTIIRNIDWKNEDNLWIATGKASPSSPNTHNNLGDVYGRQGNTEKSIEEFKKAIALKPNYADAYHNLGNAYHGIGRIDEAVDNYKMAIKFNPRLWQSYQNLGAIYFNKGDAKLAEEYFRKVVQIRPADSDSHANMGILYLMLGKKEEAKTEFQEALNIEPKNQRAIEGLNLASQ